MSSPNEEGSDAGDASVDRADAKKKNKICRHFSYGLIANAFSNNWEEHDIANLLILIGQQLEMNDKKMLKCLLASSSGTPGIVVILMDNGYSFTPAQLLELFIASNTSSGSFSRSMSIAMENDLFDLNDEVTLNTFVNAAENMTDYEFRRFLQSICESCSSKKKVGKVLYHLTITKFSIEEAAAMIYEIVTLDFFLDVEGDMHAFYSQLGELRERVQLLLVENEKINSRGDLIASDEDEKGNLMDFVVDDDVISYDSNSVECSDSEESVPSPSESENSDLERYRMKKKQQKAKYKANKRNKNESKNGVKKDSNTAINKKRRLVIEDSEDDVEADEEEKEQQHNNNKNNSKRVKNVPTSQSEVVELSSEGADSDSNDGSDSESEKSADRAKTINKRRKLSVSSSNSNSSDSGSESESDSEGSESESDSDRIEDASSGSENERHHLDILAADSEEEGDNNNYNINNNSEDSNSLTEHIDDEY